MFPTKKAVLNYIFKKGDEVYLLSQYSHQIS